MVTPPVLVTGLGWTTALGNDLQTVWSDLLAGKTGLAEIPCEFELRNYLAGAVEEFPQHISEEQRLRLMAVTTIRRAIENAELLPTDPRLQLVLGTSFGANLEREVGSLHRWAEEVADELGCVNPPILVSTACSSGSDAIQIGAELIRSNSDYVCVCGGVDILTTSKRLAHSALGTMSPTFLRAFDQRHDGTLLGEGAAFLVLQSEKSANSAHAMLRGVGAANDAASMTSPDLSAKGARLAIERSLTDAGIQSSEVGLINAHGSGTQINDAIERDALNALFPHDDGPTVFATKGAFGHSLGATGAIEAVALIQALKEKRVPPIYGLDYPDEDFLFALPVGRELPTNARIGLSLTLGFGGFDTSLVFEVN